MKILIGWFGHETNTFSRRKTDLDLLISQGCWYENEILEVFRGTPSYFGGMIKCADEHGIELIPTFGVENAGPILSDDCLDQVTNILLSYVKQHHGEYDGICLGLHGAGCSESCDDIETYVLKKIRSVVGWELPISVTLDLHGNISQGMCDHASGLFGIKENPHTDYSTTGYEAMDALRREIQGEIVMKSDVVQLPMLVPITVTKDYEEISDYIKDYKKEHNLLDLAFFPGFPYSDTEFTCASVFVTGNGSQKHHAEIIANYIWERRTDIVDINAYDATEAIREAVSYLREKDAGLCIINEEADNPGAGTPGDGTFLLRSLIDANIEGTAFAYIYDPEVVEIAHKASVGSKIDITLGGKIEEESIHGAPLKLNGVSVRSITTGEFIATTPLMKNIPGSFGLTVGLRYGNVDFVVASVQNQTYDDRAFVVGGIDIYQKKLIALKSSQHFKAFFKDMAGKIIAANPMGLSTRNLNLFNYTKINRPMFPLDNFRE